MITLVVCDRPSTFTSGIRLAIAAIGFLTNRQASVVVLFQAQMVCREACCLGLVGRGILAVGLGCGFRARLG